MKVHLDEHGCVVGNSLRAFVWIGVFRRYGQLALVAEAPPAAQIASEVMPGAQHAIEYHVVTRGSCWISLVGDVGSEPVRLRRGDIAVIPHGDPHVVSSEPGMRATPNAGIHRRPKDDNALPFMLQTGGEAERYPPDLWFLQLRCAPVQSAAGIAAAPYTVGPDVSHASNGLLDQFIRFATAEMGNKRAGSQSILNRLSELMFVEVVRLHMGQLANNNTGWLAGLRDSLVGRALTLLHGRPTHACTLEELASERRIPLGVRRSICPFGWLSADLIFGSMAHADGRQAAGRSQCLDCLCRLRSRL